MGVTTGMQHPAKAHACAPNTLDLPGLEATICVVMWLACQGVSNTRQLP